MINRSNPGSNGRTAHSGGGSYAGSAAYVRTGANDCGSANDCGWVVEPGDSAGLRRVLEQLIADPGEVLRRRRNAWHAGQEIYDQRNLARPWIAVLESALTGDR